MLFAADLPTGLVVAPGKPPSWESTTNTALVGPCIANGAKITCDLGTTRTWELGSTVVVTVYVKVEQSGSLVNKAKVTDGSGANRESQATVVVAPSVRACSTR